MSRRTAILIASSSFPDEPKLDTLIGPERDVEALRATLSHEKSSVFNEIVVLKNQQSHKVRLTLNRVLRSASKEDQVLVYYSGHGKLDPTGRLCLTMSDTVLDALEASSVRIGEIKDFLDASKCRQVMLVLDCCYSGAVGKDFVARSAVDDQLHLTAEGAGMCIMTASTSVQTAMESSETGLGVFTRHLIEGIETGVADQNGDGVVTFDELFTYIDQRIKAEGHQRPQHWAFQAEGSLVVARSGKSEELRQRIRAQLIDLAQKTELHEILPAALELLNAPQSGYTARQQAQFKLLEEFVAGKTKLVSFVMAWTRLSLASDSGRIPAASALASVEKKASKKAPRLAPAKDAAAQKDIDFGQIVLSALLPHARETDFWVAPGIPRAKLEKAREFCEVPESEEILGLVDCTYWGACDDAVLFGCSALYHHNKTGSRHGSLPYLEFLKCNFQAQGTEVLLGNGDGIETDGSAVTANWIPDVAAWRASRCRVVAAHAASHTARAKRPHSRSAACRAMRANTEEGSGAAAIASGVATASAPSAAAVASSSVGRATGSGSRSAVASMAGVRQSVASSAPPAARSAPKSAVTPPTLRAPRARTT